MRYAHRAKGELGTAELRQNVPATGDFEDVDQKNAMAEWEDLYKTKHNKYSLQVSGEQNKTSHNSKPYRFSNLHAEPVIVFCPFFFLLGHHYLHLSYTQ